MNGGQIVLAVMSSIPALIIAWLSFRASRSTAMTQGDAARAAAMVAAEPGMQQVLNETFKMILGERDKTLAIMDKAMAAMQKDIGNLKSYQVETSEWHTDHVNNFDNPARQIIEEVAPHELPKLLLTPFPKWRDG